MVQDHRPSKNENLWAILQIAPTTIFFFSWTKIIYLFFFFFFTFCAVEFLWILIDGLNFFMINEFSTSYNVFIMYI